MSLRRGSKVWVQDRDSAWVADVVIEFIGKQVFSSLSLSLSPPLSIFPSLSLSLALPLSDLFPPQCVWD
ncbi:hypothetical protein DCAR_0623488 [Daucus carota subsp. sativus]|uniref:Myosin N-terminal SH3-like domain-containing protein n=1 Tax=Daucus carota subsp. sativus TaxID=79200 RepID=A0AAF0XCU9_DAUCS|nr:hypothetical protein DCAR_0623366 [Daucus carota subsp. sativus]WOH04082.1 hypothetical protein DCAR_0623488 [Daucus carota subsp. sativus]